MKTLFPCLLLAALLLSGCLKSFTRLRVQPDGKAMLEETLLMSKEFMGMMMQDSTNQDSNNTTNRREAMNAMFAEGGMFEFHRARLQRTEPLEDSSYVGMKFYYEIDNIDSLHIKDSPKAANAMGGQPNTEPTADESKKKKGTLFRFSKATAGQPALLTVIDLDSADKKAETTPAKTEKSSKKKKKKKGESDSSANAFAMGIMEGIMEVAGDMQMQMIVECQGTIVSSTATKTEGNRITFGDINFSQLKKDWKKYCTPEMLSTMKDPTAIMKDPKLRIPGIYIEPKPVVTIQFK